MNSVTVHLNVQDRPDFYDPFNAFSAQQQPFVWSPRNDRPPNNNNNESHALPSIPIIPLNNPRPISPLTISEENPSQPFRFNNRSDPVANPILRDYGIAQQSRRVRNEEPQRDGNGIASRYFPTGFSNPRRGAGTIFFRSNRDLSVRRANNINWRAPARSNPSLVEPQRPSTPERNASSNRTSWNDEESSDDELLRVPNFSRNNNQNNYVPRYLQNRFARLPNTNNADSQPRTGRLFGNNNNATRSRFERCPVPAESNRFRFANFRTQNARANTNNNQLNDVDQNGHEENLNNERVLKVINL